MAESRRIKRCEGLEVYLKEVIKTVENFLLEESPNVPKLKSQRSLLQSCKWFDWTPEGNLESDWARGNQYNCDSTNEGHSTNLWIIVSIGFDYWRCYGF